MIKITATEVNKLRQATGVGMMDCKKALQESNGDYDLAINYLRKKGQKISDIRADKEAKEGVVIAKTNNEENFGSIITINCETDFVAKNEEFLKFSRLILQKAVEEKVKSIDSVNVMEINGSAIKDLVTDMVGKIGEKIQISDYQYIDAPFVCSYIHSNNKVSSIVGFNKRDLGEMGKHISMHVVAINPRYLDQKEIPKEVIEKELQLGREQASQEGRPDNLIEKIANGKLSKFCKENTLLNQEFIMDNKKTVRQCLSDFDSTLEVLEFKRVSIS
jgi:elongation factor Ts